MEGDVFYKVRITPELIETLMTRDVHGNLVTYSAGEADADGFVDLIFTVHHDNNLIQRLKVCANCANCSQSEIEYEGWHHWCTRLSSKDVAPFDACHLDPSQWEEREASGE
jgi:hypothetical protein